MEKNQITKVIESSLGDSNNVKFLGCKETGIIRGIVFGDVHLGHDVVRSSKIIKTLEDMITSVDISKLDIIIIEGDLFDKSLTYHHEDIPIVEAWFSKLLDRCEHHNIALRVLEGTPSHDMKQSANLLKLNAVKGNKVDLKYYDDIALEINEELGYSCIYVPDEIDSPHINCFNRARDLLTSAGLEKATFAVMHGSFDYQFPSYMNVDSHDSKLWMSIIEDYIFIGHVHNRSFHKGTIIASGSSERLRHGEEEEKGITWFECSNDYKKQKFIVNKDATIFKTYKVCEINDKIIDDIDSILKGLPEGSNFRFMGTDRSVLQGYMGHFMLRYLNINFKTEVEDPDKKKKNQLTYPSIKSLVAPKNLTSKNTGPMLIEKMSKRLSEDQINRAKEILEEVA